MRIGIVGAGALGCLFGSLLGRAGNQVTLVYRNRSFASSVRRNGVRIQGLSGRRFIGPVTAKLAPADLSQEDLVIFAVKSYDTKQAALAHRDRAGTRVPILTLQNGLGNVQILSKMFGQNRVLAGTTTEASLLRGPGEVVHTGRGETRVGEPGKATSSRCVLIAHEFSRAGIKTSVTGNIDGAIWAKTIINSAINPLSALLRVPNGALGTEPGLVRSMFEVMREGVAVSKVGRVRLDPSRPESVLLRVVRATASNRSSMLQDLEKGRMTEIRQLNGAIARIGIRHGVPVPLNHLLTSMVITAEKTYVKGPLQYRPQQKTSLSTAQKRLGSPGEIRTPVSR